MSSFNFLEDVSLVNKDLSASLFDVVCSTIVICSTLCVRTAGCFGFSFKKATGTCRLHDSFVFSSTLPENRVWKAVRCVQREPRPGVHCLPSCYCIMPVRLKTTWEGAKSYCAARGSILVKVDTRERLDFIISITRAKFSGLLNMRTDGYKNKTTHTWQWSDGTLVDTSLMKISNVGNCVNIWRAVNSLDDSICTDYTHFVCQKGIF